MRRSSRAPRPPTTQIRQPRGHLGVQQTPRAHKSQLNRESGAGCRELPPPPAFKTALPIPAKTAHREPPTDRGGASARHQTRGHSPTSAFGVRRELQAPPVACLLRTISRPPGPGDRLGDEGGLRLDDRAAAQRTPALVRPRVGGSYPTIEAVRSQRTPPPGARLYHSRRPPGCFARLPVARVCSAVVGRPRPAGVLTALRGSNRPGRRCPSRRPTRQRDAREARARNPRQSIEVARRQLALPFGRRRKRAPARRRRDPDERLPRKRSSGDSTGAAERLFYGWRLLAVRGSERSRRRWRGSAAKRWSALGVRAVAFPSSGNWLSTLPSRSSVVPCREGVCRRP